jgi:predicted permease
VLSSLVQDVRFTFRQIRRAPAFAISAILTLGLGVGANTGIFSLLNGYLRPLPVLDASRIVIVAAQMPGDETGFRYRFSYPALTDYREETGAFSDVFAFDTRIAGLTARGRTTQFVFHAVTGNFFSGLGVQPLLGRAIEQGEGEHPGGERVVVLGYQFWQRRFGGDANVVGETVKIDGLSTRIVGIAPRGFHGLYQGADIEGYVPVGSLGGRGSRGSQSERLFVDRTFRYLTMTARLRPGVSVEAAQQAVDAIAARLRGAYPQEKDISARVMPETMARPIPMRFLSELLPLLQTSMLGLAGLVLLIACMNVANLLLVRATARQREMAMRAALGSGRARLVRLLLVESLFLSIAGTLAGLVLAKWATGVFVGRLNVAVDIPLNLDFHYDWRVFAYAALLAIATGTLMGLAPAIRASRARVTALLHDGGHGGSSGAGRQRLRSGMVIAQVAGSLVLLVVAGLCVRSAQRAQRMDLGFDPANVLTLRIDPHQVGYSGPRATAFYDELERRIRALPSVTPTPPRSASRWATSSTGPRRTKASCSRAREPLQHRLQSGHASVLRLDADPHRRRPRLHGPGRRKRAARRRRQRDARAAPVAGTDADRQTARDAALRGQPVGGRRRRQGQQVPGGVREPAAARVLRDASKPELHARDSRAVVLAARAPRAAPAARDRRARS